MTSLVAGSTQTTSYSYDNANRLTSTTLPDGSVETRSYTAAADLASIESVKSGTTITSSSYSYDSLGRKTGETTPSYALAYTYDNGGQLTGEVRTGASAYSISYTYDNAGNRATKTLGGTTENYSYDNANKLLTAGGKSYSYDNAGNMTGVSWSGGSTSLTWNGAGYLKSASDGSTTVNYAYNGLGQRVGKSGGASASYILSDDGIDSQVLNDGAASFVHGASGLVSENRGGSSKFYHTDALGSVKALTDGSGSVTDSRSTDAFGLVVTSSGSIPTPFGFAGNHGYQQDSETGLMRLGHRMYDTSTGRFISRDPIRDGYNWYTYCQNDPINDVDPKGLQRTQAGVAETAANHAGLGTGTDMSIGIGEIGSLRPPTFTLPTIDIPPYYLPIPGQAMIYPVDVDGFNVNMHDGLIGNADGHFVGQITVQDGKITAVDGKVFLYPDRYDTNQRPNTQGDFIRNGLTWILEQQINGVGLINGTTPRPFDIHIVGYIPVHQRF